MDKKNNFWKSAFISGLYLGIILIIYSLIIYMLGDVFNQTLGYISYLIYIVGLVYFQINYRNKELEGNINYSKAFKYGFWVIFFASLVTSIYTYALYKFIDPALTEQIGIMSEERLINMGYSDEQIDMSLRIMEKIQTPIVLTIIAFFSSIFMGLILSLITSIFTKKTAPEFEEDE